MSGLPEVPTDELLSFQDYPSVHTGSSVSPGYSKTHVEIDLSKESDTFTNYDAKTEANPLDTAEKNPSMSKSFWTIEYYQGFFDVDTQDVLQRIISSVIPRRDNLYSNNIKQKPDLYGPFWISITLIFTIAISGNVADYLQHANAKYHWKYDFHLVSYAATTICLYVTIIPLVLWSLLKWSSEVNDLDGLEDGKTLGVLELMCVYGYSLFVYIPVSILWSIQVQWLQWLLAMVAAFLSGSVLLLTLMPAFKLSRHNLLLNIATISCHLLLAAGFMLYFFHGPNSTIIESHLHPTINHSVASNLTKNQ